MLDLAVTIWLLISMVFLWRSHVAVQGTTLESAWRWGMGAGVLWLTGWASELLPEAVPDGLRDQIWYLAALVLLAALVTVLGAKRPGSRVWLWFVTLPMLLVQGWPLLFSWSHGWPPTPLRLMSPALCAYAIVCVMGLGNYIGTRFLTSAFWLGLALAWLVLPYSGWLPDVLPTAHDCRARASLCAGFAIIWPAALAPTSRLARGWDRVWTDFVNLFGIVWGRRLQDRFNDAAAKARWGVQLDFYGLTWVQTANADQAARAIPPEWTPEMMRTLQWLLRRFVDDRWLNQRLDQPLTDSFPTGEN